MKYKNAKIVITIDNFGYFLDMDEKQAVLEALAKDLRHPKAVEEYVQDDSVVVEVLDLDQ